MTKGIPDGYMENANGALIPIENIKAIDLQRDELVREIIESAEQIAGTVANFREWAFARVDEFVAESAAKYKVKYRGSTGKAKGGIQLTTFDGSYKVQIANQETMSFDERLQVAKDLIYKCVRKWSEGSRPEILTLINDAFQVDKAGNISTSRVLGLRRHEIKDPDWQQAMKAIGDSLAVTNSKKYIRVYKRLDNGEYKMIPLDVATA